MPRLITLIALGLIALVAAGAASGASPRVAQIDLATSLDSADPAFSYTTISWQLQQATCAKLVNYADAPGAAATLRPEVAARMPQISTDGRTYTFEVRAGFRFSPPSGATVTA